MPNETTTDKPHATPVLNYLMAVLSGALLYASFFPLNQGYLAWIALVPLLRLVRSDMPRRQWIFAGFLAGCAFYLPATQWMRVAHPAMVHDVVRDDDLLHARG